MSAARGASARAWLVLAVLCASGPAWGGQKLVGSTESVPRGAVTGGGQLATGAGTSLNNALCESGVSTFTGAGVRLYSGLMHLAAQPGTLTQLIVVSKATGTLELAWTAPGLDGFSGAVPAGVYRVDASSDPSHSFAPTTYLAEFATAAAPGDRHAASVTGLLPNTTYFVRVYLGDDRKVLAEDSSQAAASSLARVPASAAVGVVGCSAINVTWTPPAGGAEGYALEASSTDFGALSPGGAVYYSSTTDGAAVSLAVPGLTQGVTYYLRLASLNWQSDANFTAGLSTVTGTGGVLPILGLSLTPNALDRRVLLTWTVPPVVCTANAGVVVLVSTNPITAGLVDGSPYPQGTVLADLSVVKASAAAVAHLEAPLELDTTHYFKLFNKDALSAYAVGVATQVVLDLPPMAPAGLSSVLSPDQATFTLSWSGVTANKDGSAFKVAGSPSSWELDRFNVFRATGIVRATWVYIGSAPIAATSYAAAVPVPGDRYFYKVVAADAFGVEVDQAMVMDTDGSLYAVAPDGISRLRVPAGETAALLAGGNAYGAPLLIRAEEEPSLLGGRVVKSVAFRALRSPGNEPASRFQWSDPRLEVHLRYEVAGGLIVPSAAPAAGPAATTQAYLPLEPKVNAADAPSQLGAYWNNGQDWVKLFGRVDPVDQTVRVQSGMPGAYQIRTVFREQAFNFDLSGTFNKAITPNGDGLNDVSVFVFDNPRDSAFRGRIFDMRGAFVSEMRAGPVANSLQWDGKADGRPVSRGVYVYQIQGEGRTFNGTLLVVR